MKPSELVGAHGGLVARMWTVLGAALLIVPSTGQSAALQARPLSLRQAMEEALLNNNLLQIQRIYPEVARMTLRASQGYYDPIFSSQARHDDISDTGGFDPLNPTASNVGYSIRTDSVNLGLNGYLPSGLTYNLGGTYQHANGFRSGLNLDSYRVTTGIFLQQPLLRNSWIDLPRWIIQVNKGNLKISELGVRFVAMDVINQTAQTYDDLVYAWEHLRVEQDLLATSDQFLKGVKEQVQVGTMTVREESQALAQFGRIKTDVIAASNLVVLAGNNLKGLMGLTVSNWTEGLLNPTDRLIIPVDIFDLGTSWGKALARRPDLLQLLQHVENAEVDVKFRRNQLFPSLDLIGSYGRRGASFVDVFPPDTLSASRSQAFDQVRDGVAPNYMYGVLFTIPLSFTAERANYRASKETRRIAQLQVKGMEERIMREISDSFHTAQSGLERVESAHDAVGYAENALKAEEDKLRAGASSVFFVLQFQNDVATARSAELLAKRDYMKAVSQLHFSEGTLLEENGIVLQFE